MTIPGRQNISSRSARIPGRTAPLLRNNNNEDIFETKAPLGCNSMEDADYLRLFQRYLNESGGMLRRGDLERRDTKGERLSC